MSPCFALLHDENLSWLSLRSSTCCGVWVGAMAPELPSCRQEPVSVYKLSSLAMTVTCIAQLLGRGVTSRHLCVMPRSPELHAASLPIHSLHAAEEVPVPDREGNTLVKTWCSPQGCGCREVSKFPNSA